MMIRIETGVNVEVQVGLIIKLENKGGEQAAKVPLFVIAPVKIKESE
jgi:hypothetical protein